MTVDGRRTLAPGEDPVCAMTVDPMEAARDGRTVQHEGADYSFCSPGCLLEFRDDPAWFLDPAYVPALM